jgi:formylglycine-generating enzyme required for sulfatase activity
VAERVRAGFLLGDLGDPRFPVTIEQWQHEAEKALSGDTSGYFCKVEPGTYIVGSSDDDPDADDDEKPQHTVTFDAPFWIARYPITKVQYIGWETRQESEGATSDLISPIRLSSNQPIEVSKWVAINFCSWIGFQIQENVRLPTHEEWIAVIRGVNNTRYPWGDNWNENCISDNRPLNTVPVGCFPKGASHCGAMDMLGTVFEWTVGETRAITSSELLALKETPSSFSGFRIVLAPLDSTTTYEDD